MKKSLNSATVGALVRQARIAAGISQTELGRRIGASRFWVAEFEKGKPSAELGRALRAMDALGLSVRIEPEGTSGRGMHPPPHSTGQHAELAKIIARATLTNVAPSSVIGWPTAPASSRRSRKP